MSLSDVCVDLFGKIIVAGRVHFPTDDRGYFTVPEHSHLRIDPRKSRIEITPSSPPTRDMETGFLAADEIGPLVYICKSISQQILKILGGHSEERSIKVTNSINEGELLSFRFREFDNGRPINRAELKHPYYQHLSDWTLEVSTDERGQNFFIRAALFTNVAIDKWRRNCENFWSLSGESPQYLEIKFTVDHFTRAAAFGSMWFAIHGDTAEPEISKAEPTLITTTLERPLLGNALTDFFGYLYAITTDRHWVKLDDSADRNGRGCSLVIFLQSQPVRLLNGFLHESLGRRPLAEYYETAAIHLDGINLDKIYSFLRYNLSNTIELRDGYFGWLLPANGRVFHERHGGVTQSITRAIVESSLSSAGWRFAYKLFVLGLNVGRSSKTEDGWLDGEFLIPWEVLILRFPDFLLRRSQLLGK
jgi:hypothetical protein